MQGGGVGLVRGRGWWRGASPCRGEWEERGWWRGASPCRGEWEGRGW